MCHISGLDLNLHFLEAVCRPKTGNAVTSRHASVKFFLFPARTIGTGTHTHTRTTPGRGRSGVRVPVRHRFPSACFPASSLNPNAIALVHLEMPVST
jgi:hypothetical protein